MESWISDFYHRNAKIPNILPHTLLTGMRRQRDTVGVVVNECQMTGVHILALVPQWLGAILAKTFTLLTVDCMHLPCLMHRVLAEMSGGNLMTVYM